MTTFHNIFWPACIIILLIVAFNLSCSTACLLDQTKALPRVQFPILASLKINSKSADILNPCSANRGDWNMYLLEGKKFCIVFQMSKFDIFTFLNFMMTWLPECYYSNDNIRSIWSFGWPRPIHQDYPSSQTCTPILLETETGIKWVWWMRILASIFIIFMLIFLLILMLLVLTLALMLKLV